MTFICEEQGWSTCGRDIITGKMSQVFESYGENSICKDRGTGWLLLGAVDSIKKENDPLRSINYQFKANC